jgi:hypothetical protein
MKAVVCTGYGGPEKLELREVPKPSPKRSDILIKVKATTVTAGDCRMREIPLSPYALDTGQNYFRDLPAPKEYFRDGDRGSGGGRWSRGRAFCPWR